RLRTAPAHPVERGSGGQIDGPLLALGHRLKSCAPHEPPKIRWNVLGAMAEQGNRRCREHAGQAMRPTERNHSLQTLSLCGACLIYQTGRRQPIVERQTEQRRAPPGAVFEKTVMLPALVCRFLIAGCSLRQPASYLMQHGFGLRSQNAVVSVDACLPEHFN